MVDMQARIQAALTGTCRVPMSEKPTQVIPDGHRMHEMYATNDAAVGINPRNKYFPVDIGCKSGILSKQGEQLVYHLQIDREGKISADIGLPHLKLWQSLPVDQKTGAIINKPNSIEDLSLKRDK